MHAEGHAPGRIALLGSGETSLAGGRVFESLARVLPTPLRVVILETPAGFELNSNWVAGRIADFLAVRLHNYRPAITVVAARARRDWVTADALRARIAALGWQVEDTAEGPRVTRLA